MKIRQWNGVASWLWVANDENCGICRMAFNGCCPECEYAKLKLAQWRVILFGLFNVIVRTLFKEKGVF